MKHPTRLLLSLIGFLPFVAPAGDYLISQPGEILLAEDFNGSAVLPPKFTVGVGDWAIVRGSLRGRQQAADKHTAFRKIFLDHQDVIYEFDVKIDEKTYSQLLINYDLVHLAKAVTRLDSVSVHKILEQKKRDQMAAEKRDQGLDPLQGNWSEKTTALDTAPLKLFPGQWYHVIVELIGDQISMQISGQSIQGRHLSLTEKKTNFGFQAGGFDGFVYYDNVKVSQALPQ